MGAQPQALSPLGPEAGGAQLAFDALGNGFAVWGQFDGAALTVWLARFDPSIGAWRLPGQQLSPLGQETLSPHVAVDGVGNALVAWIREAAGTYYVQGLKYTASAMTWSAPVDIATAGPNGAGPEIAMTPGGDAIVVWTAVTSDLPLAISIQAAHFSATTGTWTAATQVSTPAVGAGAVGFRSMPAAQSVPARFRACRW